MDNKVVVQQFLDALNSDDLHVLSDICSPEIAEGWSEGIQHGSFSDHHLDVAEMVAEDDKVMVILATRAAVTGDFHGIPPSGKRMTNKGAVFLRITDGKITQIDPFFDDLNIVTDQLGATLVPPDASS